MSIRILLIAAIYFAGACSPSLAQDIPANPPKASTKNAEIGAKRVEVFRCTNITSADALAILQKIFADSNLGRIVADTRGNTLIVSGTEEMHKQFRDLLQELDQPASLTQGEAQLVKLQTEFLKNHKGLISSFAESSGVTIAVEENMGLVMLKGKKGQVEETERFIDVLKQIKVETSRPKMSVAIRVLWLTNGQLPSEMATEADPKLQQIIDRLGKKGIQNLAIGMQLISRCDPSPGAPGKCKISGVVDLKDSSQELLVDARFNEVQNTRLFHGHVDIRAKRMLKAPGDGWSSTVEVDVNIEPGNYYVLSSTPVGNHHSVFVVQLLEEF